MIIELIGEGLEKPLLRKSRKLKSLLCDKETEGAICPEKKRENRGISLNKFRQEYLNEILLSLLDTSIYKSAYKPFWLHQAIELHAMIKLPPSQNQLFFNFTNWPSKNLVLPDSQKYKKQQVHMTLQVNVTYARQVRRKHYIGNAAVVQSSRGFTSNAAGCMFEFRHNSWHKWLKHVMTALQLNGQGSSEITIKRNRMSR